MHQPKTRAKNLFPQQETSMNNRANRTIVSANKSVADR